MTAFSRKLSSSTTTAYATSPRRRDNKYAGILWDQSVRHNNLSWTYIVISIRAFPRSVVRCEHTGFSPGARALFTGFGRRFAIVYLTFITPERQRICIYGHRFLTKLK